MSDNIKEEIEDKIIDCISLGAGGRLVVFKPENSGRDLVVEKKGDYKKKVISLNIYGKEFSSEQDFGNEIRKLAVQKNFKAEEDFYLVFVYFDIVKQDISDSFLVIPSLDLSRLSRQGRDNRGSTIESGQKLADKNDFSKFSVTKKDFPKFLIKMLDKK
jgi:hypothetical protein